MRIGENLTFHHLHLDWQGSTLGIGRAGERICELADVRHTHAERRQLPGQEILFLKTTAADGGVSALFIDYDGVQTNVRRVAPDLADVDAVLAWLLPPGFLCRQGDVGFYPRAALPAGARCLGASPGAGELAALLNRRHLFEPAESCRFFAGDGGNAGEAGDGGDAGDAGDAESYHVQILAPARVVHPEHEALPLAPGTYQILGARGEPLSGATAPRAARVDLLVL